MKAIIPIGGGEISLKSTLKIDEYIVSLVTSETKKVLFMTNRHTTYKQLRKW